MRRTALAFLLVLLCLPAVSAAETGIESARVVEIVTEETREIPGTGATALVQELRAELKSGEVISVYNDRVPLAAGDTFFVRAEEMVDGPAYTVHDADRRTALVAAVLVFAGVVVAVGRLVGVRALVSLGVSGVLIMFVLVPLLISGMSPLVTCALGSALILAAAMVITHGWSRGTLAAFGASLVTIIVAIVASDFFVAFAHLTGYTDDASTVLNLSTGHALRMDGLLLGGLIIGVLGIIDDLAVTQVATVAELRAANASLGQGELYRRAMQVGREHLGAVVNTLVFAYAGASLPLLLLFSLSSAETSLLLNSEIIAVEIVRAAVGGAALALVIPLATHFGLWSKSSSPTAGHTHSVH